MPLAKERIKETMNYSLLTSKIDEQALTNYGSFDPFADLMVMQAARPPHWQPIDLRTLTPFQRALVSIDGTVTKFYGLGGNLVLPWYVRR